MFATFRRLVRCGAASVVLITALCSCGSREPAATNPTPTPEAPSSTVVPDEPTPASVTTTAVQVYWAWSIPSHPGSPERLGVGGRVGNATTPARAAIEALLAGPDTGEAEIGMATSIPADTRLLDLNIASGTATVDLSAEFERSMGTLGELTSAAQIVFTLTQFVTVDTVRFRIDGADRDSIGSHGLDVAGGVDRGDFSAIRPLISIEHPFPNATVTDGFMIRGESNTFEGNVQWAVTDREGLIVAEGFTTATAGNGTWGQYEISADLPDSLEGRGAVIVFDTSAKTGEQISVIEYPVSLS